MNTLLWILQVLLALVFFVTGFSKLVRTKQELLPQMGALENLSLKQIRMIGLAEIAGAIGLILPSLTRILPWLSPLAAIGLVLVMVGAVVSHYRRKEIPMIAITLVLLILSFIVVVGRFWLMPL